MELVYLWVEEYKNIKNQGFNFSPRFKCEFKAKYEKNGNDKKKLKDDCELEIIPTKDFVSIFPNNINVTAIVGKNGSGKSSILELIAKILSNDIDNLKYILLTKEIDLKIYKSDITYLIDKKLIIEDANISDKYYIFHSNSFTSGYFDNLLDNFSSKNYKYFNESNIRNQSSLNQFLNANRVLESYSLSSLKYRQKHSLYIEEFLKAFKNSKILMQLDFINKFKETFFPFNLPNQLTISIQHNPNTASIHEEKFYDKVKSTIISFHSTKSLGEDDKKEFMFSQSEIDLLQYLDKYKNTGAYETIVLDLNEAKILIDIYTKIKIKIFELEWYGLSSGQEALLNLYTLLLHGIESLYGENNKEDINLIISLDEVENNFHPHWQKFLVEKLIEFFQFIQKHYIDNYVFKLNIQIIFASHSPFILSDIPKDNVIFLEKYHNEDDEVKNGNQKIGNCKNVSKHIKLKTFGANIHTLLSNGFFMSDGLMGEFAKNKINEAIDNLHGKSQSLLQKQIKSIIDTIGEPFLQIKLEQMYKEKFGLEDEIKELEKRQKEINLKIEQLKKQKAENAKS
ncbi:AAA family ATPase [Aliarcobacter butzleri]|uniref:AAA family ATPase n=1 Tax=Aliarcobacter butzleri TaxID=28197 RepID=UPI003AF5B9E8